jgi:3,4-dihydroxy 2-butanone 4-phosphate synthase / GTP cyclohydrolase II
MTTLSRATGRPSVIEFFMRVHDIVAAFAAGKPVLIIDAERENEGDVAIAADRITSEGIAFMATQARGLICVPMLGKRLDELELPLMAERKDQDVPAFTVSVDARLGVTTGISAEDRARTVRTLIHSSTKPDDLIRPGHIFPLRYAEGGLLTRRGHTEAAVDLALLAGSYPAVVICEVMNDDGSMARDDALYRFAHKHNLVVVTIAELVEYRRRTAAVQTPVEDYDRQAAAETPQPVDEKKVRNGSAPDKQGPASPEIPPPLPNPPPPGWRG